MHRPGTDPDNVRMSDVLCDFCRREWTETLPVIEGHHGSIICGNCLAVAFSDVVLHRVGMGAPGYRCTMCLEQRPDLAWQSPMHPETHVCERCVKVAAAALERDPDYGWTRPTA